MINNIDKSTILILRQKERALPLQNFLIKKGYKVIIEPIFNIKPLPLKNINFKDFCAIMITSANTIKVLSKNNNFDKFKKIKTFCVGKITHKIAKNEGFNCINTQAYSAITLEKEIIKKIKPSNKKILILGGEKLAHDPSSNFNKAKLQSERIIIYKTLANNSLSKKSIEVINNKTISNIVIYSPETAKTFIKLSKKYNLNTIKFVCLGDNTKKVLNGKNWKKVQVVKNTDLKTFANALIEY